MVQFRRRTKKSRLFYHLTIFFLKKLKLVQGQVKKDQGQIMRFEVLGPGPRGPGL